MIIKNCPTLILIHGAWHGNWCWELVTPLLEQSGFKVLVPNLPGHPPTQDHFCDITLASYVQAIAHLVDQQEHPVVLVGHSLAGMIISQVAENLPHKIQELIYVAGFVPTHQSSVLSLANTFTSKGVSPEMEVNPERNSVSLKKSDRLKNLFFNMTPKFLAEKAFHHLQEEPFQPYQDSVHLSHTRFGQVKKSYIECLQDQAILPIDQQRMQQTIACQVITLTDADHSPFYSMPEALVSAIVKNLR